MALLRADLAAYLAGTLAQTLAAAKVPATDTPGGLKEPLDDAFRRLGADPLAGQIDGQDASLVFAVVRVEGLRRCRDAAATQVDLSAGNNAVSLKRSQFVAALDRMIADAEAVARSWGAAGPADDLALTTGRITFATAPVSDYA